MRRYHSEEIDPFYFECKQAGSHKFWAAEIVVKKNNYFLVRRYGKIGQEGKTMVEEFSYMSDAERRKDRLVEEKMAKGYKPVM